MAPFFDNSIRFSKPQGFYDDEFDLIIKTRRGAHLYYTLDGSAPTMESIKYTGPIHISDATSNNNTYSMQEEISVLYREDLTGDKNPHVAPQYKVDKCTPIRVASFDKNGGVLNEAIQCYWVGFNNKKGYDGLYIVSLVTDPSNLFDYEGGIYVNGKTFDLYMEQGDISRNYNEWETNYNITGVESRRPGYFTIYSNERKNIFSSECDLRIQGQGSRRLAQKSFCILAKDVGNTKNRFQINLFGGREGVNKFKLFAGGQDTILKLKDWLVSSIVRESDLQIAVQSMIPAALFLDGEYWGTYYLVENFDKTYINNHYGVSKDNVIIIKDGKIEEGTEGDQEKYYDALRNFVIQNGAEDDLLEFIDERYYDLDSFIDYCALEVYIGNKDWYEDFNTECWRVREKENGKYSDGKLRWMLYDVNYIGCFTDPDNSALQQCFDENLVFNALMKNPVFRERFRERIIYISEELFSEENIDNYIEPWFKMMETPLEKSSMRFYGKDNSEFIDEEIVGIKEYCKNRESALLEQLNHIEE